MKLKEFIVRWCPPALRPLLERVEGSPLGYRLASGGFWSVAGAVISRGLTLAATILIARMLGKSTYGELGIIQSTVGMFSVFAGFRLGITASKHVAEYRRTDPERAGRIISLAGTFAFISGGIFSLLLFIFAPWIASHVINAPHLAGLLRVAALLMFILALNDAQNGTLSGFEAFKTIAIVNLFSGLLSFPLLVIGAYLAGLKGAVWALVVNAAFLWLFNQIALRKVAHKHHVPLKFRGILKERSVLWHFSLPALLGSALVNPVNWACGAILVNQPGGYAEMGILNAANQWFALIIFLPTLLGNVILPILSERLGQDDKKQSRKMLILAIQLNAFLILPLVLLAAIASPWIMDLYGSDFASGWPTLVAVLFTAGLLAIQMPVGQTIAASGKMWLGFTMNASWAALYLIGTVTLIDLGSLGLALARGFAYVIHTFWTFGFVYFFTREKKS